jgi:peptide/nickel transport system substrate-binding protein
VKNNLELKIIWSKFTFAPTLLFCDLAFPNESSPFHDARVRRAASYAINRKVICEKVLHGAAEPWGDIFAPYEPGYNPDLKPDPYDPEKAKALLKEAGYPNGFDTTFTYGFPIIDKIQIQAVAADLARVGIRAKLVELEAGTFMGNWREKKFRGLTSGSTAYWGGISHPGVALESFVSSGSYWTYFTTPQIDEAWKKLSALTDEKAIVVQARELSRIWHKSEIRSILWAIHRPFGISPKVKSYKAVPGVVQVTGLEFLELKD